MYIWTIPPTKQKKNVLSLRAAKGENGATTTTTMLPRHRLYRNDIDSIVGLLNIRRRLTAGRTRIYARESTIVLFKNGFTRSHTARTFDSGGAHTHTYTYSLAHTYTYTHPLPFVHRVSHRVNDTRHSLWRAVSAKSVDSLIEPCSTAGYNDRPCCVEIFKVSL